MTDSVATTGPVDTGGQQPAANAVVEPGKQENQPPAPKPGPPAPKQENQPEPPQETDSERVERLERELSAARREAAKDRVNAKKAAADTREQEVVKTILAALGLKEDGSKEVTVDTVTAELTKAQTELRELKLRETVRAAVKDVPGADADRLLTHAPFLETVRALEDGDANGLKTAIGDTLNVAPWLRVAPAVTRSGSEPGGSGEADVTAEQFAAMSNPEKNALFAKNPELFLKLAG